MGKFGSRPLRVAVHLWRPYMEQSYLDIWRQAVCDQVTRNGAVEVTSLAKQPNGAVAPMYRCRLLDSDPSGGLIVERPTQAGVSAQLAAGVEVQVVIVHEGQRWEARCRVVDGLEYALNASTSTRALRLTSPAMVASGQRRQFFRVGVGRGEAGISLFAELPPVATGQGDSALTFRPAPVELKATLANLSGGGMGVTVPCSPQVTACLKATREFRCELQIPQLPEAVDIPVRLIHLEPLANDHLYLGLSFRFDGPNHERLAQDAILRFSTELQRRQLRRQRGA